MFYMFPLRGNPHISRNMFLYMSLFVLVHRVSSSCMLLYALVTVTSVFDLGCSMGCVAQLTFTPLQVFPVHSCALAA